MEGEVSPGCLIMGGGVGKTSDKNPLIIFEVGQNGLKRLLALLSSLNNEFLTKQKIYLYWESKITFNGCC